VAAVLRPDGHGIFSWRRPRWTISFEGDVFETEDQRNWTDASFKTYCPPLRLPYPRPFEAGGGAEPAGRRPARFGPHAFPRGPGPLCSH